MKTERSLKFVKASKWEIVECALITTGVLTAGLISFKQGNSQLGQILMRARVVAQGGTVALMVGTAAYYGEKYKYQRFPTFTPNMQAVVRPKPSFGTETTFFISNLPEGITDARFKEAFLKFGRLSDAYVARKRDRRGNIFGFIRFIDVKEVNNLLLELNSVKLEGAKLEANIAKYLKGGNQQHVNKASMGRSKDMGITQTRNQMLTGAIVRYMGGLRIMISYPCTAIVKKVVMEHRRKLESWFSQFAIWHGQEHEYSKKVDGENAWEVRSHMDEREEGEILEHNHDGYGHETIGEVQPNVRETEACMVGGNLNMENYGPMNADPIGFTNLGLVGHQSDLIDVRPKKRSRAKEGGKDGAKINSLDVPSLTPDLNLPPLGKNSHQRRHRHDGVFYFGNALDAGLDNTHNQVDNTNVEEHVVDEVDDTIRVGKLLGIDVVDFRSQIEEIIGGKANLKETQLADNSKVILSQMWGNNHLVYENVNARGRSGGLSLTRLHEYRIGGIKFTYMSPDGSKGSKIDRMLVCDCFFHKWPCATFFAHPQLWSDHSPISLSTVCLDFGPPPFKFYNSWLQVEGLDNVVWSAVADCMVLGRPDVILMAKLRNIKMKIKEWRKLMSDNEIGLNEILTEECKRYETLAEISFIPDQEQVATISAVDPDLDFFTDAPDYLKHVDKSQLRIVE
ncbi:hypothetical protein E3N88_19986 [Mikania micrantha]|uniref:RRM domain-containing protein n=1 Tax=Mikania micrantha TaxID=192012 RepID=A0A5N6NG72_9ASTR|nr:hypothetical protein E3N88_19986 [Mikania micrantha]